MSKEEEEEEMEDLADFDESDLFERSNSAQVLPPAADEVSQDSSMTPKSTSAPTGKRSGWRQFNSAEQQAEAVPSRKRERLDAASLFSRSSVSAADSEIFSTILISKLPVEVRLTKIATHFETFGAINEIFVDREQNRGLVRFANVNAAQNAIKTPFNIFNHRMVLDRVKEEELGNNALAQVASTIFTALEAKQHGLDHPIMTLTVEQTECASNRPMITSATTRMSYRAPETPNQATAAAPSKPRVDIALQRDIQRAALKIQLEQKNLEKAHKSLAQCKEGLKLAKEKLNQISKDPDMRSKVIAEVTSFTFEMKTAQASVIQAESNLQAARKEQERLQNAAKAPPPVTAPAASSLSPPAPAAATLVSDHPASVVPAEEGGQEE